MAAISIASRLMESRKYVTGAGVILDALKATFIRLRPSATTSAWQNGNPRIVEVPPIQDGQVGTRRHEEADGRQLENSPENCLEDDAEGVVSQQKKYIIKFLFGVSFGHPKLMRRLISWFYVNIAIQRQRNCFVRRCHY